MSNKEAVSKYCEHLFLYAVNVDAVMLMRWKFSYKLTNYVYNIIFIFAGKCFRGECVAAMSSVTPISCGLNEGSNAVVSLNSFVTYAWIFGYVHNILLYFFLFNMIYEH